MTHQDGGGAIELERFTGQLGQPETIRQAVEVWRETATCALDNEAGALETTL